MPLVSSPRHPTAEHTLGRVQSWQCLACDAVNGTAFEEGCPVCGAGVPVPSRAPVPAKANTPVRRVVRRAIGPPPPPAKAPEPEPAPPTEPESVLLLEGVVQLFQVGEEVELVLTPTSEEAVTVRSPSAVMAFGEAVEQLQARRQASGPVFFRADGTPHPLDVHQLVYDALRQTEADTPEGTRQLNTLIAQLATFLEINDA